MPVATFYGPTAADVEAQKRRAIQTAYVLRFDVTHTTHPRPATLLKFGNMRGMEVTTAVELGPENKERVKGMVRFYEKEGLGLVKESLGYICEAGFRR